VTLALKQIRLRRMALFAYLIGDLESRTAVLVDPAFDTDRILTLAKAEGFRVSTVVNTHGHPDHTAGNAAVKRSTGSCILIHSADAPALTQITSRLFARVLGGRGSPRPDRLLSDGDTIAVGKGALQVIHTPGHTPGGICLHWPGHLLTGDTLFVGGVGRTDLAGGNAGQLLTSIRGRILTLAPETIVWPGHDYGPAPRSTVGREAATNPFIAATPGG
jgi:hydroxyacylglutathione hydrolase